MLIVVLLFVCFCGKFGVKKFGLGNFVVAGGKKIAELVTLFQRIFNNSVLLPHHHPLFQYHHTHRSPKYPLPGNLGIHL